MIQEAVSTSRLGDSSSSCAGWRWRAAPCVFRRVVSLRTIPARSSLRLSTGATSCFVWSFF